MKILDRYIIKQFISTILFGLLAFTMIFVVVDMMENLDDFIDQNVPFSLIFQYYFVFSPEIIKLMTPVAVLFSGLFTAGKMSNLNELTAIKSSGVSLYRFMLPMLIVTLFVSLFSIYFGGYVVPKAIKHKTEIERTYLNKNFLFAGSNLFFQDASNRIVNISYFDAPNNQALRASIQTFDKSDLTKMIQRIDAQRMKFDSTKNHWVAYEGVKRDFLERSENIEYFGILELSQLNFTPIELTTKQQKPEEMNLSELSSFIESQTKAGTDTNRVTIEYYSRFSFAMASFVVVLFGLPISTNRRKGGIALQFGINILITFIYLGLMQISMAFGKNGAMDPVLTAWIVNIIFFFSAMINLFQVKQ